VELTLVRHKLVYSIVFSRQFRGLSLWMPLLFSTVDSYLNAAFVERPFEVLFVVKTFLRCVRQSVVRGTQYAHRTCRA
jgi:hypothetical protein